MKYWEKVGEIDVDAGLCWLGDPCYIMGKDADEHPVENWEQFCNKLGDKDITQWSYKSGQLGLA